jgi:hypothetical protein
VEIRDIFIDKNAKGIAVYIGPDPLSRAKLSFFSNFFRGTHPLSITPG